jgi:KRAB domain-containing zinc finger protein
MKCVNQKMRFQCPKCPKNYRRKYALKAHMNVSHGEVKRHQCYFCSFAYFKKSHMIRHMFNHTKEKPYKCHYCCQWYKTAASVKNHKDGKSCNPKITNPPLSPCYFCGKALSNYQRLKEHMKIVHLKEELKRCSLCCKYYSSTTAVNHHIRTVHLLERNSKCQLCSKTFGSSADLNHHIRSVHTKEKHFKCYFCSKSFVKFVGLKLHTWIHTREKPLTCYFCRKPFSVPKCLSVHIRKFHTKDITF